MWRFRKESRRICRRRKTVVARRVRFRIVLESQRVVQDRSGQGFFRFRLRRVTYRIVRFGELAVDAEALARFADDQDSEGRLARKAGRAAGTAEIGAVGPVFVKMHRHAPWWTRVLHRLDENRFPSPALREWQNLLWACRNGVPTARPLWLCEVMGPGLRLRGTLGLQDLSNWLPLHLAIPKAQAELSRSALLTWKRALTQELARLAARLHRAGRFHKDLYLCHFLVLRADFGRNELRGRVRLVDWHRVACPRWRSKRWQIKDLAQLAFSSDLEGVTARDRVRFFACYSRQLARVPPRPSRILRKAERYRLHNEGEA